MRRMSEPINTVLLSCGSFNPITNMHLRIFELAKDFMNRETNYRVIKGIISPTHDSYETKKRLEPAVHRCRMTELALSPLFNEEHWVRVDEWESRQNRWNRTREVMDYHFNQFKDQNMSLKLLCGADLFETFNVPNLWKDEDITAILKYGLVVITRDGYDPWKTLNTSDKSALLLEHKDNIFIVKEKIPNLVSSTAIRESIRNGESIRYLVPDSVIEYIKSHKLYEQ